MTVAVTVAPGFAIVGVTEIVVGGVAAVTATLSNVAVLSVAVFALVAINPMYAEAPMLSVVLPTVAHAAPSPEIAAVTVVPARVSLSHAGGACVAAARKLVCAPALWRVMNSTSLVGRRSRMTCAAPAASDSRIMTPAFAYALGFCRLATRATICVSPLIG